MQDVVTCWGQAVRHCCCAVWLTAHSQRRGLPGSPFPCGTLVLTPLAWLVWGHRASLCPRSDHQSGTVQGGPQKAEMKGWPVGCGRLWFRKECWWQLRLSRHLSLAHFTPAGSRVTSGFLYVGWGVLIFFSRVSFWKWSCLLKCVSFKAFDNTNFLKPFSGVSTALDFHTLSCFC